MYRLRGTLLGLDGGREAELYVDAAGRFADGRPAGADTLVDGGFLVPGLVDAHCHVGLGPHGAVPLDEAALQAQTDRDAGTLLIRDCGSPVDTRPLQDRPELPEIVRAGRHLGRPKRYIPGLGLELDDPALLPDAVREQARAGDGWVKLVGDWIDREVGDLAPLWPDDVLAAAIGAAHAEGARVTAHVFGTDALPGLIGAGIDCIEHGTGLTTDLIDAMVTRGTVLVPTVMQLAKFPEYAAAGAERFPAYSATMTDLHLRTRDTLMAAYEAGVPMFAGSDGGGIARHGNLAGEIQAMADLGMGAFAALGAASWRAREWLGWNPTLTEGAPADFVVYPDDPLKNLAVLRHPSAIVLRGRVVS